MQDFLYAVTAGCPPCHPTKQCLSTEGVLLFELNKGMRTWTSDKLIREKNVQIQTHGTILSYWTVLVVYPKLNLSTLLLTSSDIPTDIGLLLNLLNWMNTLHTSLELSPVRNGIISGSHDNVNKTLVNDIGCVQKLVSWQDHSDEEYTPSNYNLRKLLILTTLTLLFNTNATHSLRFIGHFPGNLS